MSSSKFRVWETVEGCGMLQEGTRGYAGTLVPSIKSFPTPPHPKLVLRCVHNLRIFQSYVSRPFQRRLLSIMTSVNPQQPKIFTLQGEMRFLPG